ncbi:sensor histidine kinase [Pontibacter harenae]|uniref:sensor histidine kinase n=1 Tax=Pontibacter harenae TaxID=2894083 RepID=UPI001E3C6F89|nr:HAMP domain-containing sensor histidine kinase [Pontibacter harenae]MCC9167237.1 HAMP domain-containing histidine kinase [Pontibacter harenae]
MNFRSKLTLTFTVLIATVISVLSLTIYFFAKQYTYSDFNDRLKTRAYTIAQVYLEEDELNRQAYRDILKMYQVPLSDEEAYIYDAQRMPAFESDTLELSSQNEILDKIRSDSYLEFKRQDRQWVGLFYQDNQGDHYVFASARDVAGKRKLENLRNILLLCFFGSTGLVWALGYFLSGLVLRPIATLIKEVNTIRASNLHLRLQEPSEHDEISALTKTFNQMLDRLEVSFEMQKNFIANASHELRNPLTALSGEIEITLRRQRTPAEYINSLETLQKETDRLEKLTSDLLRLAQAGFDEAEVKQEKVRPDELLLECLAELRYSETVRLCLDDMPEQSESLSIMGNTSLLKMAIMNVLENAIKFSGKYVVTVRLQLQEQKLAIVVEDQGIGIPQDDITHVLQPFYRAKNARGHAGTGIGLSLSDKIVRLHGGKLSINSTEGRGTTITLLLHCS